MASQKIAVLPFLPQDFPNHQRTPRSDAVEKSPAGDELTVIRSLFIRGKNGNALARRKAKRRKPIREEKIAKTAAPDILNGVLASGGSISFHCGSLTRRFVGQNKIQEEGFWYAEDGMGNRIQIPYKLTATMGRPVSEPDQSAETRGRRESVASITTRARIAAVQSE